jgi:hypothetical protein
MTFIFSLRRTLLVLMVATHLCLGLASVASAASAASARIPAPHRILRPSAGLTDSPHGLLWHLLHEVWQAVGSSMDPLGNH